MSTAQRRMLLAIRSVVEFGNIAPAIRSKTSRKSAEMKRPRKSPRLSRQPRTILKAAAP